MRAHESVELFSLGSEEPRVVSGSLIALGKGGPYHLYSAAQRADAAAFGEPRQLELDEIDELSETYALPAARKTDMSVRAAALLRRKEARARRALELASKERAVQEATRLWMLEQAELAHELGLSLPAWQRVSTLL